jgi:hypothetical protein
MVRREKLHLFRGASEAGDRNFCQDRDIANPQHWQANADNTRILAS